MQWWIVAVCLIAATQTSQTCSCVDSTAFYTFSCFCGCTSDTIVKACTTQYVCNSCISSWWAILLIILAIIFVIALVVFLVRRFRSNRQKYSSNNVLLVANDQTRI